MRASDNFIEVTGAINGKKFLVNKSAIIFVMKEEEGDGAVISTLNGDRVYRIVTKESYNKVANSLLNWCDFRLDPFSAYAEPGVCEAGKEEKDE